MHCYNVEPHIAAAIGHNQFTVVSGHRHPEPSSDSNLNHAPLLRLVSSDIGVVILVFGRVRWWSPSSLSWVAGCRRMQRKCETAVSPHSGWRWGVDGRHRCSGKR